MSDQATRWLCRCEGVSAVQVDQAIAEGNLTVNDVKRRTRAGMGICQGIYCVEHIAAALAAAGVELASIEPMTPRPPTRVVALGAIDGTLRRPDLQQAVGEHGMTSPRAVGGNHE